MSRRALAREVAVVLCVTFGASALRAVLRLIDALVDPAPLNEQQVTLNAPQSQLAWLDLGLQAVSALVLIAWGALAVHLLACLPGPEAPGRRLPRRRGYSAADWARGAGLAALIGLPGLVFYLTAVHLGLSRVVVPAGFADPQLEVPALLAHSAANAFGEEAVVVAWLVTRARQLRASPAVAVGASAALRGAYHLYQGVSAGVGNIVMGVVFAWFFHRTGRWWPLVIAHFLIDAVAFTGYAGLSAAGWLDWLGQAG